MEKQELFRVFDACQPTVAQVREYLERISGYSPFALVFNKNGEEIVTNQLEQNKGQLVGVIIESTIFYTQVMSKKDNPKDKRLSCRDVFAFGYKIDPTARPMKTKDLKLLNKYRKEYSKLFDMVQIFDYFLPALQNSYVILNEPSTYTFLDTYDLSGYCDGSSDISHYLHFRNIIFCADWKKIVPRKEKCRERGIQRVRVI